MKIIRALVIGDRVMLFTTVPDHVSIVNGELVLEFRASDPRLPSGKIDSSTVKCIKRDFGLMPDEIIELEGF